MKNYTTKLFMLVILSTQMACSSDETESISEVNTSKTLSFTALQENGETQTKAALSGSNINWELNDNISVFDGTGNNKFDLTSGQGTTSGTFSGSAASVDTYYAVYPYTNEATLSDDKVEGITLPATQVATDGGFDPKAALMIAKNESNTLKFKNAVGYIKVKPKFDCSNIVVKAADESQVLAGKGTISYNGGEPTIEFTDKKAYSIRLTGTIKADTEYYIAVPAVTLNGGWKIVFTASSDKSLYIRQGNADITFSRSKVIDLGEFDNTATYWHDVRGSVDQSKEVDMGIVQVNEEQYHLFFTKSNLTQSGLAANDYDFGDYYAWSATEPVCTSYIISNTGTNLTLNALHWATGKQEGYCWKNTPYVNEAKDGCTKYINDGDKLDMIDDAAHVRLGGDWQLPPKEILEAMLSSSSYSWQWTTINEYNGYKIIYGSNSIFLPAGGRIEEKNPYEVGVSCRYWTNTAGPSSTAYILYISNGTDNDIPNQYPYRGNSIRPIRLVPE